LRLVLIPSSPSIIFAMVLGLFVSLSGVTNAEAQDGGSSSEVGPDERIEDSPFESLEVACIEARLGAACFEAAAGWHKGRGLTRPNPLQAFNLYKAGCGFGYAPACTAAAIMILQAQAWDFILKPDGTLSLDFGEAARLAGMACTLGDSASCGLYGDLMIDPDSQLPNDATTHHNIRHDPLAARQAYMDGCPLPEEQSVPPVQRSALCCGRLAQLFEEGAAGLRKSPENAVIYYRLGCQTDPNSEMCIRADLLEADAIENETPSKKGVKKTPQRTNNQRSSIQPRRPAPDISRFRDTPDAVTSSSGQQSHHRRFDLTLGLGGRWTYDESPITGMKLRVGGVIWFNMIGISIDVGFITDRFARIYDRNYLRFQSGVGPQVAFPIPDNLPYPIDFRVVLGVGGTVGALKRGGEGDFLLGYGARQRVQLEVGTSRQGGPRQWGALRFEQQQTFYADQGDVVEHSSQVVLIAGFSFGGLDADWTPKKTELD